MLHDQNIYSRHFAQQQQAKREAKEQKELKQCRILVLFILSSYIFFALFL